MNTNIVVNTDYDGICVYSIRNSVTGKRYIGSTVNLSRRIKQHCRSTPNYHFEEDKDIGQFIVEIVKAFPDGCDAEELVKEEREAVIEYNSFYPNGYNDPKYSPVHCFKRGSADTYLLSLKISKKDCKEIKKAAEKANQSVQDFIMEAVHERMEKEQKK